MIIQKELIEHSEKYEVPTSTIDKDWVLGHLLNAMFCFERVKELFVFKGGTCLKKCYIQDFRFSGDLDFTLIDTDFPLDEDIIRTFLKKANELSGIGFHIFNFKKQIFEDNNQGYEVILKFWGANHKANQAPLPVKRWQDKIKIDVVFSKKILEKHLKKNIHHPYSDKRLIFNSVNTYSFNEIVAEKLRSLIQRNRPRDIFDNWYFANNTASKDIPLIKNLLFEKAKIKDIKITNIEQFVNEEKRKRNKRAWSESLKLQMSVKKLPDFDVAYDTIISFISNILNS
jgi:predicted nucleotidyltransferase component of viral defense system